MARQSWRLLNTGLAVPACFNVVLDSLPWLAPQPEKLKIVSRIPKRLSPLIFINDLISCGFRHDTTCSQDARIPLSRH